MRYVRRHLCFGRDRCCKVFGKVERGSHISDRSINRLRIANGFWSTGMNRNYLKPNSWRRKEREPGQDDKRTGVNCQRDIESVPSRSCGDALIREQGEHAFTDAGGLPV